MGARLTVSAERYKEAPSHNLGEEFAVQLPLDRMLALRSRTLNLETIYRNEFTVHELLYYGLTVL